MSSRLAAVIVSTLLVCSTWVEAETPSVGWRFGGGPGRIGMKDYHDGLANWKHLIDPRYNVISGGESHLALDMSVEARIRVSRIAHLGLGTDALIFRTSFSHDRAVPEQIPLHRDTEHRVTALPIKLSLYLKSPDSKWSPYYRLGFGFYPGWMSFVTERVQGDTTETRDSRLNGYGWGMDFGIGLERTIQSKFAMFAELFYRRAELRGFKGSQDKSFRGTVSSRDVELVFWDSPYGYRNYQVLPVGTTTEPDPELKPRTRPGVVDFTGLYFIAGIIWTP